MQVSGHLGFLVLFHYFTASHQTSFGNSFVPSNIPTAASSSYTAGTFAAIGNASSCSGSVTRWNVCYYPTAGSTPASVTLAVYSNYNSIVTGSLTTLTISNFTSSSYTCINKPANPPFTVKRGDFLVGCIPSQNGLKIIADISGTSVNYSNSSCDDGALTKNSFQRVNGVTLLVSLDVNECTVSNGGCGQICNDTTSGYFCSCYPGYQLDSSGVNCSATSTNFATSYFATRIPTLTALAPTTSTTAAISYTDTMAITSSRTSATILNTANSPMVTGALTNSFTSLTSAVAINVKTPSAFESLSTISFGPLATKSLVTDAITPLISAIDFQSTNINSLSRYVISPSPTAPQSTSDSMEITVIVVFIIAAMIAAITLLIISIVIWQRKYTRKLNTSPADGIMYDSTNFSTIDTQLNGSYAICNELINVNQQSQPQEYEVARNHRTDDVYTYIGDPILEDQEANSEGHENPYILPARCEEELYIQLEKQRIKKIPRNSIQATSIIGSGQFGGVQMGIWNGSKGRCEVAIKTLNPTITQPDAKVKFLQEAAIMVQFKHPNVIQLYGIVTDGEPIMLVIELAPKRDLKAHLCTLKTNPGQMILPDTPLKLLTYSKQIAAGMKYLSNKSFVHRDLAARNILLTQNCICKIADFGLSRDLADDTYYVSHGGMVPIKWTAPEAIHFKKYSTASDVWSYGCLLYEIWSMGLKPYQHLTNIEVVRKVESGYRLPPPPGCPQLVYQIMIQCWNPETHSRPKFQEIYLSLSQSEDFVLSIPDEAHLHHPQAGILGAPLEAGEKMYIELQNSYVI